MKIHIGFLTGNSQKTTQAPQEPPRGSPKGLPEKGVGIPRGFHPKRANST